MTDLQKQAINIAEEIIIASVLDGDVNATIAEEFSNFSPDNIVELRELVLDRLRDNAPMTFVKTSNAIYQITDDMKMTPEHKDTVVLVDDNGSELHSDNLAVWAHFWNNILVSDDIRDWFYYECVFRVYDGLGYYEEVETSTMILAFHGYMIDWHNGTGSLFYDIKLGLNFALDSDYIEAYDMLEDIDIQANTNLNW